MNTLTRTNVKHNLTATKIDGQLQFRWQSDPRDCSGQECKDPLLYCTVQYYKLIHSTVLYSTGRRAQVDIYFSAAHILSRKGLNSMNPSSFSGSHSSFMRALASS